VTVLNIFDALLDVQILLGYATVAVLCSSAHRGIDRPTWMMRQLVYASRAHVIKVYEGTLCSKNAPSHKVGLPWRPMIGTMIILTGAECVAVGNGAAAVADFFSGAASPTTGTVFKSDFGTEWGRGTHQTDI
jgi:hypothetical protein